MSVDSQNCTIISIGSICFDPPILNFHSRCSQQLVTYWHPSSSATSTHFMLVLWYNNTDTVDENIVMKLWIMNMLEKIITEVGKIIFTKV